MKKIEKILLYTLLLPSLSLAQGKFQMATSEDLSVFDKVLERSQRKDNPEDKSGKVPQQLMKHERIQNENQQSDSKSVNPKLKRSQKRLEDDLAKTRRQQERMQEIQQQRQQEKIYQSDDFQQDGHYGGGGSGSGGGGQHRYGR